MTMSAHAFTDEIAIVVKHTFINVSLSSMAQNSRRRSSVPAGLRLSPFAVKQAETCNISDVSTDSATDSLWESQEEEQDGNEQDVACESLHVHRCSEFDKPRPLAPTLCSSPSAWQPLEAWQSQRFDKQVADIKAKVEVAMVCSDYDVDVHIRKESNGYIVSVSVAEEDAERFGNDILAEAQETLLTASEQSTCVYVMGEGHQPFQAISNGFVTTLAEIQDKEAACWDIYSGGTCPHGCACIRQHPRSIAYIVVQLIA
jgi:hypothetical protein